MAFVVSSLTPFTKEVTKDILLEMLAESKTFNTVAVQPGIKYKEKLNYMEIDPVIVAATCDFNPAGTVTLSQREITVAALEVQMKLCAKTLEKYWIGQNMKPGVATDDTTINDQIKEALIANLKDQNEIAFWVGTTATTLFDGFTTILATEATRVTGATFTGTTTSANIIAYINAMISAIPEAIRMKPLTLWLSAAKFDLARAAIIDGKYPLILPDTKDQYTMLWPYNNMITLRATHGLVGSNNMVLTFDENLVIGTDLMNEEEKFLMKYDEFDDNIKINVQWKLGTQIKYPALTVTNF